VTVREHMCLIRIQQVVGSDPAVPTRYLSSSIWPAYIGSAAAE
jgi:hypothetical protein